MDRFRPRASRHRQRRLLLLTLLVGLLQTPVARAMAPPHRAPHVLLISIDSFRPDYLRQGHTPTLDALAASGSAGRLRPSFPTLTFPNHYALVTGRRPDRNGIVDNTMEDPRLGRFALTEPNAMADPRWWDEAEPIWITAERQGLKSGVVFWPGSQVAIGGVRPTSLRVFEPRVDSRARVDTLLGWYDHGNGPDLGVLYFDAVDLAAHFKGPGTPGLFEVVADVDREIGRLLQGLRDRGVTDLDVVVVSDHGMTPTSRDRIVRLDALSPSGWRTIAAGASPGLTQGGPFVGIAPVRPHGADALLGRHPHFACWRKSDLPRRFAYGRNPRVPPVLCLADEGWLLLDGRGGDDLAKTPPGSHGFDPDLPSSEALLIASGPDLRAGATVGLVDNVEVHRLVGGLLGLRLPTDDGRGRLEALLTKRGRR